jgi:chemotaxis signal transduction protein
MNAERAKSYVLFPMGAKRFALPAEFVEELARPDHLQTFPHCTPLLTGVLVRRGRIVPVCDVAQILVGPEAPPRKFYLIANREAASRQDNVEAKFYRGITQFQEGRFQDALASLEPAKPEAGQPPYVSGVLEAGEESVPIVDLEKLIAPEVAR